MVETGFQKHQYADNFLFFLYPDFSSGPLGYPSSCMIGLLLALISVSDPRGQKETGLQPLRKWAFSSSLSHLPSDQSRRLANTVKLPYLTTHIQLRHFKKFITKYIFWTEVLLTTATTFIVAIILEFRPPLSIQTVEIEWERSVRWELHCYVVRPSSPKAFKHKWLIK